MIRFLILVFCFLCGAALAVAMFTGCSGGFIVIDTDVDIDTGGDAGAGDCAAACANLELLGCDGAEGSPGVDEEFGTADDVSCEAVCVDVEANGVSMHTGCVAAAGSCEAVDECFD